MRARRVLLSVGLILIGVVVGLAFGLAWHRGGAFLAVTPTPMNSDRASDAANTADLNLGKPRNSGPPVEITLTALVDGSDKFVFAGETVWNEHLRWQAPKDVTFNGLPWTDLTTAPQGWADTARNLDLRRATIVARKGRDVVSLEVTAEGFDLYIADTQMGSGAYEVTVSIPRR